MRKHRTRSGRIHDFITGFWNALGDQPANAVQIKMLYPDRRRLSAWRRDALKAEIRYRLFREYGMYQDDVNRWCKGDSSWKPRVRHKLRPTYFWDGEKYIGVYQCIIVGVISAFFLSSQPAEATYAGVSSVASDIHDLRGGVRPDVYRRSNVPLVLKSPPATTVWHPSIKYLVDLPKVPSERDWIVCQAYMQLLTNQAKYQALVEGPKPAKRDWRKFWLTVIGTFTAAFAIGMAFVYRHWRAFR